MTRSVAFAALLAVCFASPVAAEPVTVCGHVVRTEKLVFERALKWFAIDRKEKKAIGSFITDCEADGARWIVSSPDGTPGHPHLVAYRYR